MANEILRAAASIISRGSSPYGSHVPWFLVCISGRLPPVDASKACAVWIKSCSQFLGSSSVHCPLLLVKLPELLLSCGFEQLQVIPSAAPKVLGLGKARLIRLQ